MTKYKRGDVLTHIPLNQRCVVVHNTLAPGGVNESEAVIFIRMVNNTMQTIPVKYQDEWLTTRPPKATLKNGFGILPSATPAVGPQVKESEI